MQEVNELLIKESAADARRRQRLVQRQKNDGTFVETILDQAKEALRLMEDPSMEALDLDARFAGGFEDEDTKKLRIYIQNLRAKHRRGTVSQDDGTMQDKDFKEKVKSFVNRKVDKLHQSILIPQSEAERAVVIFEAIDKNLFDFLEYMDNYPAPSQDFLRIIIGLQNQVDEESFTSLFVRVCSKHSGDPLDVTSQMVERAMTYLVEVETNQQAAYGLLRLVFINQLSLHDFEVNLLLAFQRIYPHAIIRFFKSLGIQDDEIIPLLPPTCFIFTSPLIQALKSGGSDLHHKLPPTFLPYIFEIVCYSFCENQQDLNKFLEVLRAGCKRHSHKLNRSDFSSLLKEILKCTVIRKNTFFKTLKTHTDAIDRAFVLLEERRIEYFDDATIQAILSGGEQGYQIMKTRPKIVSSHSAEEFNQLFQQIMNLNPKFSFPKDLIDSSLQAADVRSFKAMGIQMLLPNQSICYQLLTAALPKKRWFIQYQTGQGKTALCLAIGSYFAKASRIVFLVNYSQELTFRDYKKAQAISHEIGINCHHADNSFSEILTNDTIIFTTFENFVLILDQIDKKILEKITLIVDEFDAVLFEKRYETTKVLKSFLMISHTIAMTGSELQTCHRLFIETRLEAQLISLMNRPSEIHEAQCSGMHLFNTKKEYKEEIVRQCMELSQLRPVVLIVGESASDINKCLRSHSQHTEPLFELTVAAIDSAITTFTAAQNGRFSVYVVNQQQGRGVDFPTCCEIEKNGGIHVVIGTLPEFYLQLKQFIGRTARIGNKGSYSLVILDKTQKNSTAEVFFQKKMEELKNNDLIYLSSADMRPTVPINSATLNKDDEEIKQSQTNQTVSQICLAGKMNFQPSGSDNREKPEKEELKESIKTENKENLPNQENIKNSQSFASSSGQQNRKRDEKLEQKLEQKSNQVRKRRGHELQECDLLYFDGYSLMGIHEEMLSDEARVDAYRVAIKSLAHQKVVIDVGTGTGILATMAMDYGAKCVHAIEFSPIAQKAQEAFQKRHDRKKLALYRCLAEDFKIGSDKADLLVSEWMGYFLIMEHMLPSVLAVRDSCMNQIFEIIPREAELLISAYQDSKLHDLSLQENIPHELLLEEMVKDCPGEWIASSVATILKLKLKVDNFFSNSFKSSVNLTVQKDGLLHGLCSWFTCQMAPGSVLDTGPFSAPTHWKQTMFPFTTPIAAKKEDNLEVTIEVHPLPDNHRGLKVDIQATISGSGETVQRTYSMA